MFHSQRWGGINGIQRRFIGSPRFTVYAAAHSGACFFRQSIVRIAGQKCPVQFLRRSRVAQIMLLNRPLLQQSAAAQWAARIFVTQKFVLRDRIVQKFGIVKGATFARQQIGDRGHAGRSVRGTWIAVINRAIRIQDVVIFRSRATGDRARVQMALNILRARKVDLTLAMRAGSIRRWQNQNRPHA